MAEATNVKIAPARGVVTLADMVRGRKDSPDRIVFHGQGGTGKTSFAAYAPNPFFLLSRGETGLYKLMESGLVPECPSIESPDWKSTLSILGELRDTASSRKTLVVDTCDGFSNLACEHVLATEFGNDLDKFTAYAAGPRAVSMREWPKLLNALDAIRNDRGMGIIMLCHTGVANFKDPEEPYDRWTPAMYKDIWQLTFGWADMVLYGYRQVEYVARDKKGTKYKAEGDGDLLWKTVWSPRADAKNRHNLPPEISLGNSGQEAWNNLQQAILEGRKNAAKGA